MQTGLCNCLAGPKEQGKLCLIKLLAADGCVNHQALNLQPLDDLELRRNSENEEWRDLRINHHLEQESVLCLIE